MLAGRFWMCQSSAMNSLREFSRFLATPAPPELGPGPRDGVQAQSELDAALDHCLLPSKLPSDNQQLIRALLLLWHDHLEPAHQLAQSLDTADGAFVHGILHRREPDYGNAAYWFRRVGPHPAFPALAKRVAEFSSSISHASLLQRLIKNGQWDPLAFVDACSSLASKPPSDAGQRYLREVQRIETETLLDWLIQRR